MERRLDEVGSWADGGWELIGADVDGEPWVGPVRGLDGGGIQEDRGRWDTS